MFANTFLVSKMVFFLCLLVIFSIYHKTVPKYCLGRLGHLGHSVFDFKKRAPPKFGSALSVAKHQNEHSVMRKKGLKQTNFEICKVKDFPSHNQKNTQTLI